MARIRTIKPEFFLSEDIGMVTPIARLLFIGLWTVADREGRLLDRPRRISVQVFPYDDDFEAEQHLDELESAGLIVRYEADGHKCIQIPGFSKHQRPHPKEPPSEIPAYTDTQSREKKRPAVEDNGETTPSRLGMDNGSGNGEGNGKKEAPRREPKEYPLPFEELWRALSAVGRLGNSSKSQTFDEWQRYGRPDGIPERWREYLGSLPEWQSPRHVNRWLKFRGHEQTYSAPEAPGQGGWGHMRGRQ